MEKQFKVCSRFVEQLYAILPGAPLQQALILLAIMEEPGIGMPDLAERFQLTGAAVSRNIRALGIYLETDKHGNSIQRGYNLVTTRPDLYRPKSLAWWLTSTGEALRDRLVHFNRKHDM
jgi:hypothetical protein